MILLIEDRYVEWKYMNYNSTMVIEAVALKTEIWVGGVEHAACVGRLDESRSDCAIG
jgi:hypothetical protein